MKPLYEHGSDLLPILRDYASRGLVSLRKHPNHDLFVASYAPAVQYSKAWDEITLQTRCIMVDKNGLVAKSFDKFFNVGEVPFISGSYFVSDKVDGSLILSAQYNGELVVTSKSSFTSEHAIEATKLLKNTQAHPYGTTYELTHPNYRIVIDYGTRPNLTYLGGVVDPREQFAAVKEPDWCGFHPPTMCAMSFTDEQSVFDFTHKHEGIEGYVLTSIFTVDGKRFKYKAKTPWYLERHKVIFGLSPARYLEVAKGGNHEEFIESLPDEFQDAAKEQINKYLLQFQDIRLLVENLASNLHYDSNNRKEYAALVMQQPANLRGMLFAAYDNGGYVPDDFVWKSVTAE